MLSTNTSLFLIFSDGLFIMAAENTKLKVNQKPLLPSAVTNGLKQKVYICPSKGIGNQGIFKTHNVLEFEVNIFSG